MNKKRDAKIDEYLRKTLRKFRSKSHNEIQPTLDFQDRVMVKISKQEQDNKRKDNFIGVGLGLSPFILHQAWLFIRGDYFSVSSFPLGDLIVRIYNSFVSPTFSYASIGFATAVFVYITFTRGWKISSRWI